MKSRTILENKKGFTLIEVLVVVSIVGVLFAAGSFVHFDTYRRESIINEEDSLVAVLHKAENRSMNNVDASAHGVHIENDAYVVFREFPYNRNKSTNEEIPKSKNITISGLNEIIFAQLSGEPSALGNITLSDGVQTKTLTLRYGGLIDW